MVVVVSGEGTKFFLLQGEGFFDFGASASWDAFRFLNVDPSALGAALTSTRLKETFNPFLCVFCLDDSTLKIR